MRGTNEEKGGHNSNKLRRPHMALRFSVFLCQRVGLSHGLSPSSSEVSVLLRSAALG